MSAVRSLRAVSPEQLGVVAGSALEQAHRDKLLPVDEGLAGLFPFGGLRRGTTIMVRGSTAVMLKLLAAATVEGSWAAVVGMPDLGILAAAELGVVVDRLAVVPKPGPDPAAVVVALLDGMDLVVVDAGTVPLSQALARRLTARARSRGSVLVVQSTRPPVSSARSDWPADIELTCSASCWSGLGRGHGHLRSRKLKVAAHGRGASARPLQAELTL